jgi:cell wall-associated NlpC family hydrolase
MRTKIFASVPILVLVSSLQGAYAAQDTPEMSALAAPQAVGTAVRPATAAGLGALAGNLPGQEPAAPVAEATPQPPEATAEPQQSKAAKLLRAGEELIIHAINLVGVRYKYGGADPDSGLDCSGFVQHVFKEAVGLALPHNAYSISLQGRRVTQTELQPGDVVFFNTLKRAFSHVGIYIGGNRFVHAGRSNQQVEVSELDSYWAKRFDGARRLIDRRDDDAK